ncbi:MAG TPA: hypothetical protein VHT03_06900 [Rhizomicrobium sp.]|jgi:hypothetical protein|nr:hypothetical protein [Rhizomicrobium sp.]
MPPPRRDTAFTTNIKEHSGWWAPLAVLAAVVLLSLFVLVYYFAPNPVSLIEERPSPSTRVDRVSVRVGDDTFLIPANYLVFASARKGGTRREIDIAASVPDFRGYSDEERSLFSASGPTSPIVHIKLREESYNVPEAVRLSRVYLGQVIDPRGSGGPAGLTQYEFRDDSGYRGQDLFVGRDGAQIVVLLCERPGIDVPSPNCLRDYPLGNGAALAYRFKRARLSTWRDIARGVNKLVHSFETQ